MNCHSKLGVYHRLLPVVRYLFNLVNLALDQIKQFNFINLNWVYIWAVTIFVHFLVYLMVSSFTECARNQGLF